MADLMEQFTIKKIIPLDINNYDISLTNSAICMIITTIFISSLLLFCLRKREIIPSVAQAIPEAIYDFIKGIIGDALGKNGERYFSLIFTTFTFIFCGNALGLFPYSFTFTSHLGAVGALTLFGMATHIILGIRKRGLEFFRTFFPKGLPIALAPLFIPIEMISMASKYFSLTIRLVINMSVGHIILKILGGFIVAMGAFGFLPILASMAIILFEIFVAFLQAFIYTTLSCVYLSQAINDEH